MVINSKKLCFSVFFLDFGIILRSILTTHLCCIKNAYWIPELVISEVITLCLQVENLKILNFCMFLTFSGSIWRVFISSKSLLDKEFIPCEQFYILSHGIYLNFEKNENKWWNSEISEIFVIFDESRHFLFEKLYWFLQLLSISVSIWDTSLSETAFISS